MSAVYCTSTDLSNRLSAAGVTLRSADLAGAADFAIDQASGWIDEALLPRYGAELVNSRWVKNACASLAVVVLCQRLGNPAPESVLMEYDRLMGPPGGKGGELEKMRRGLKNVPDIAALVSGAPRLTNVHISERPVPHPVAEPARSTTGQTITPRRDDRWDPLRWSWEW